MEAAESRELVEESDDESSSESENCEGRGIGLVVGTALSRLCLKSLDMAV